MNAWNSWAKNRGWALLYTINWYVEFLILNHNDLYTQIAVISVVVLASIQTAHCHGQHAISDPKVYVGVGSLQFRVR